MISSVTTAVTTVATSALGATLGATTSAVLVLLLATKELATAHVRSRVRALGRTLDVAIVPLLFCFGLVVALKALEILA